MQVGAFCFFLHFHQFDKVIFPGGYSNNEVEGVTRSNPQCCFMGNIVEDLSFCRNEGRRIMFFNNMLQFIFILVVFWNLN